MRYDVFLSFCGEEIRKTFLSHLLYSLDRKGITSVTSAAVYPPEDQGSMQFLVAISVISKNYTCLDLWVEELARVIACKRKAVPIFLRVDPMDVLRVLRLAEASVGINEPRRNTLETVKNWLDGHVADKSGFNSSDWEDDSQLVDKITCFIFETVRQDSTSGAKEYHSLNWVRRPELESTTSMEDRMTSSSGRLKNIDIVELSLAHHRKASETSESWSLEKAPRSPTLHHERRPSSEFSTDEIIRDKSETITSSWWNKISRRIPFVHRTKPSDPMESSWPDESTKSKVISKLSLSMELSSEEEVIRDESCEHSSNPSRWGGLSRRIPLMHHSKPSKAIKSTTYDASSCDLPGMKRGAKEVLSILRGNSTKEVRIIGVYGMEGVGKTVLAKYVYEEISPQFQYHFFMNNFSKQGSSLLEIFGSSDVIKEMVGRKVLLVADRVDDIKQLKGILKEICLFGPGSRVIAITQDKFLLVQCGVKHIYQVGCPTYEEAIQFFSYFAFARNIGPSQYEGLTGRAVEVAGRIPLALKVLGSFLYGRSIDEWESTMHRLEEAHDNYTAAEVLKKMGADDFIPKSQHRSFTL